MTAPTGPALRPNPAGDTPEVHPTAWVDPAAVLIGKVRVGPRSLVAPGAVIRADEAAEGGVAAIDVGPECNVQDGAVLHALAGTPVVLGPRTSVAHGAVVHGPCRVGQGSFIGFRAVVFGATLGAGVRIGSGAVIQNVGIPDGTAIAPGAIILTSKDVVGLPPATAEDRAFMDEVVETNLTLAEGYRALADRADG